MKTESIVSG